MTGEVEFGGAHYAWIGVVVGVKVLDCSDDVARYVDGTKGVDNEGVGDRREGNTKIEKEKCRMEARVAVASARVSMSRMSCTQVHLRISPCDARVPKRECLCQSSEQG